MPHQLDAPMHECIDRCRSCEEICVESVAHCLQMGGEHAQPDHVNLLIACAEICGTSARFVLLGSKHHVRTCEVCAEVCEDCARDCESFAGDDMMQRCADACRRCAESCRQMAGSRSRA